jgi:uncharacterized protein YndB with AHSA1/START domain
VTTTKAPAWRSASAEVSAHVAAAPERLFALVADLPRMSEWSPENIANEWIGGASGAAPGARFRGANRSGFRRWSTTCTVVVADPPRLLSWESKFFGMPIAQWTYRFEPDGRGGTTVTETVEDRRSPVMRALQPVTGVKDRAAHNRATMQTTLERLKAAAES